MSDASEEWDVLWRNVAYLSEMFPDGIVFIGGVAVYLYTRSANASGRFVEFSHDGDFLISISDFADLRDIEEVTANRRLNKYQIIREGIDFDVYLEYHNRLRIPYAEVLEGSKVIDGVRVAALEHLLLLKLAAFDARRGSAKGRKDERDLIRIGYLMDRGDVHEERFIRAVPRDVELLKTLLGSTEFITMVETTKQANSLRSRLLKITGIVDRKVRV